jgi:hypothetical protein
VTVAFWVLYVAAPFVGRCPCGRDQRHRRSHGGIERLLGGHLVVSPGRLHFVDCPHADARSAIAL